MKIVVRAPNWLGDIVMSIPFFEQLIKLSISNRLEVFVIIKPEFREVLELVNSSKILNFVSFNKKIGLFKFKKQNLELLNADLYFTLAPSFSSAMMGKILKAKKRVGYKGEMRSFLLTDSFKKLENSHRSSEYLFLLNQIFTRPREEFKLLPFEVPRSKQVKHLASYIVVNANSEATSRKLPNHKWVEIFSQVQNKKVILTGVKKDVEYIDNLIQELKKTENEFINLAGKTDLKELISILKYAALVISNDSGPAHLANLVSTPLVVFFGAGNENNTAPKLNLNQTHIINQKVSCSPCLKNSCPIGTLDCLNKIDVTKIWDKMV